MLIFEDTKPLPDKNKVKPPIKSAFPRTVTLKIVRQASVSFKDGSNVGITISLDDGKNDGVDVDVDVGCEDGFDVGCEDGCVDGCVDG